MGALRNLNICKTCLHIPVGKWLHVDCEPTIYIAFWR